MKLLAVGRPPLASLPLVAGGLIEFELTELRPFSAFRVQFAGRAPS
jgi:hypothetical protein